MQNRRALLFLVLSVALGIGAAFTAQRWLEGQRQLPASARPATQPVAVVSQDTQVGAMLRGREIITVDWPLEYVPNGAYSDPAQLEGRVLRRPLAGGEPILESALLPQGAVGGLMGVIAPTFRAVSVKVDPVVGVAGFVVPGAHVDVLVTIRRAPRSEGSAASSAVSKVILQDVEVLAVDQKVEQAKEGNPQLVQVVTLEVTPEQSEKLTYAVHEGRLQLALRNPIDREIVATHSAGVTEVLGEQPPAPTRPRVARAAPSPKTNVEVIKGVEVSVESF